MATTVCSGQAEARHDTGRVAVPWKFLTRIPVGWRMALGSLLVIVLLMGVALFAVFQLLDATTLSIELVSHHYPAVESAKWLITSLYAQLASEKKYLAVRDPWYLMEFRDEAEEFTQTLTALQSQDSAPEGRTLLGQAEQFYADYRVLFRTHVNQRTGFSPAAAAEYEKKRNAAVAQIAQCLQAYVGLHETRLSGGVQDVRLRAAQIKAFACLMLAAMLLTLAAASIAGFRLLRLVSRGQALAGQTDSAEADTAADGLVSPTVHETHALTTTLPLHTWRHRQPRQVVSYIWKGGAS